MNDLDNFYIQDFLDEEQISYRETNSGQLILQECPFCLSNDWKTYVNKETALGKCFKGDCNRGFNGPSYVMALKKVNYGTAMDLIRDGDSDMRFVEKKVAVVEEVPELVMPNALDAYRFMGVGCKNNARDYLESRGIDTRLARDFDLRYTDVGMNEDDKWDERIIFPIRNYKNELMSYQGRCVLKDAKRKRYLFPSGHASTGFCLYNIESAMGEEHIVLGEGVFDVMAIANAGYSAVGSFGMSLSIAPNSKKGDQLTQLLRLKDAGMKRLTFAWDGTSSATSAAISYAMQLRGYGIDTYLAKLPEGKDPNEISTVALENAISDAVQMNKLTAVNEAIEASKYKKNK